MGTPSVESEQNGYTVSLREIEAVAFVNPKLVPQMADADEVMAGVPRDPAVSYAGLVFNERGLDRVLGSPVPALLGRAGAFP